MSGLSFASETPFKSLAVDSGEETEKEEVPEPPSDTVRPVGIRVSAGRGGPPASANIKFLSSFVVVPEPEAPSRDASTSDTPSLSPSGSAFNPVDVPPETETPNKAPDSEPSPIANGAQKEDAEVNGPPVKGKGRKKEEEDVFRWWDADANGDDSVKWETLEHNGVIFPPLYEPLPPHVKMKYNGKPLELPPAAEEVAGFFAALIENDQSTKFNENFFDDWKKVLKTDPPRDGTKVTSFESCDFRPMFEYFEAEKARKRAMTDAEMEELKRLKDEQEAKYLTCLLDGRKEKIGNFRVEPPGLFRGRGEHPKTGSLKFRVRPEDITINIGKEAPVPVPNMPGKWKEVIHDNTVTWLATWTENVSGNHKYVFIAAGSSLKGQGDRPNSRKPAN
ncbi:hypothetical protein R3P38DRAFT_3252320 [Favolaschia claudopus]|uniref:DNA topoisomerase I eukaryotic-type domain-containing protein n=1 Tax=Favolaschia claudopus TaxID=2862362 RepID=A0AAW0DW12_9AGAR